MTGADTTPVCALLNDHSSASASSRLYTGFSHRHRCTDPATLEACWAAVAADQQRGLHAVLLADYEWGAKLIGAGRQHLKPDDHASLQVLMFRELQWLDRAGVDAWLQAQDEGSPEPTPAGPLQLQASVSEPEFCAAIEAIQEAIRRGETYQINYTYRLSGLAHGSPAALFRRLRARQPVAYGAYIVLPPSDDAQAATHILSLSPELFLRHEDGLLTAKPMKGTASRLNVPESDSEAARLLQQDIKNRAENLMIVDLLRNDLGRVAQIGSVKVPALFSVEPYATVFQMTSTVQARLAPGTHMPALLRALFPCGSITGAPKHHTMGLIADLESTPRGLYCGAIGWVDAPAAGSTYSSVGNFCCSVAIRTLSLQAPDPAHGARPLRLGVGAGIVQDSVAADEYQECRLKARFLTSLDPGFELFETIRVAPGESNSMHLPPATAGADADALQLQSLERHLARLRRSATALGFVLDEAALQQALASALDDIRSAARASSSAPPAWRLRLALRHDGRPACRWAPLADWPLDAHGRVSVRLAAQRLPDAQPLAAHKTGHRAHYDAAVARAEARGEFDELFATEDGRLSEGARSSLFLKLAGQWFTPPVADGALPGICREQVLAQGLWGEPVQERRLSLADLDRAEALCVGNALRGVLRAVLR